MLVRLQSTLATCLTGIFLSAAVGSASAATVSLPQDISPGFGSTTWYVINGGGDSASAPFSGSCDGAPGFTLDDADGPTNAGDAYDGAWQIFVNGASFAAPGNNADLTGTTLTAGPVAMSGLQVTVQHYYSPSSAVARILVSLRNPTGAAIPALVQVPVNFGSDGSSLIRHTSSGDTTVTTGDRWIISSDSSGLTGSDPVNTSVFYGPGTPAVTPTSYTQTVFSCAATNGVGATFNLTVAAGATRSLMFFAGLGGVTVNDNAIASANTAAALFNSNTTLAPDWLNGLTSTQRSQIANWTLRSFTTCAAEGFTGSKLSFCRQVCEIPQSSSSLTSLITIYRTLFREDPPCAN